MVELKQMISVIRCSVKEKGADHKKDELTC